jgi:hypothetical protein
MTLQVAFLVHSFERVRRLRRIYHVERECLSDTASPPVVSFVDGPETRSRIRHG